MKPTSLRAMSLATWSLVWALAAPLLVADEPAAEETEVLAGHSNHGEAFNEGPRQAAYLMQGMANVTFPASTDNEQAQRFINQGVAQLHGFWYYEAERSFRQAAVLDPDCAIAYWGMAMANSENRSRARSFSKEAASRKEKASRREQLYIDAYQKYCRDEDDKGKKIEKKDRAQTYTRDLESIVEEFPDDIEAKAFLALQLWQNARAELPIVSHVAIDSVIEDVFDVNPMHPAHHYRIHLWDGHKPKMALESAALAGPSSPGIAHMWHMPGHIYSKLHRYQDAAWQQEASARVDHAHMMRDRVLPDQIHNFAHNNEWLIRNLLKVGRVEDALSLSKNMLELPRHPKYNTLKRGSTKYGRERLLLTLQTYRLWPLLIELSTTMYLEPTDDPKLQTERLRYLGVAFALSGRDEDASNIEEQLQSLIDEAKASIEDLEAEAAKDKPAEKSEKSDDEEASGEKEATIESDESDETTSGGDAQKSESESLKDDSEQTPEDAKKAEANRQRREKERNEKLKRLKETLKRLEKEIAAVQAAEFAASEKWDAALELWGKSDLNDALLKAEWLAASGKFDEALKIVDKEINSKPGEVLPMACKAWLQFQNAGADSSREAFEQVRVLAASADLDTPLLARLTPLATESSAEHWAVDYEPAADFGTRPDLETLGSFRWHPYMAPDFNVQNAQGKSLSSKQIRGRPTLVIFYLGAGCLHCVEQLHEFSPRAEQFRSSGIDVMAVSTEGLELLNKGLSAYNQQLDIPLHADPELDMFKAYRCFDDFEQQPLHGTFLIDPDGHVLWQDISFEPFMDVDFVLEESHRLLKLAGFGGQLSEPAPVKTIATK